MDGDILIKIDFVSIKMEMNSFWNAGRLLITSDKKKRTTLLNSNYMIDGTKTFISVFQYPLHFMFSYSVQQNQPYTQLHH